MSYDNRKRQKRKNELLLRPMKWRTINEVVEVVERETMNDRQASEIGKM
jgi:hypothetical protein